MAPKRWSCVTLALQFLVVVQASQTQQPPDYNCSATSSMSQPSAVPEQDPCSNTTAYSDLGSCARYMVGNDTMPSVECCTSSRNIWASFPACFCKVTFFSLLPSEARVLVRARPTLCNITDDLCSQCPGVLSPYQSVIDGMARYIRGNVNIAPCYENGNCCGQGCYSH